MNLNSNYDDDEFDDPLDDSNYIIAPLQQNQETLPIKIIVSSRKGIKRVGTAYPTLKDDERYFDSFSRSLYITAKSHECEDVLVPEYTPSNSAKRII